MDPVTHALTPYDSVVITGGSSGIGAAFLRMALSSGVPIRIANLSRSTPDLTEKPGDCEHFPVDLTDSAALRATAGRLASWLDGGSGKKGILLINNSGFGSYGPFPEPGLGTTLSMVDLNLRAVVELTGILLPRILASRGGVVNVASTAAFQPLPETATYAATKAFLLQWGLALHQELKSRECFCLTLCPGPTRTAFFSAAGFKKSPLGKGFGQSADQVCLAAFRGIAKRRSLVIPGAVNTLLAGLAGVLPRRWIAPVTGRMVRSLRLQQYRQ